MQCKLGSASPLGSSEVSAAKLPQSQEDFGTQAQDAEDCLDCSAYVRLL